MTATDGPIVADSRNEASSHAFKARNYQLEMLEESLGRNVIAAMPTGSGKTLIAVMRARRALEDSESGKIVWFCVPRVELAHQQYRRMSTDLPIFQSRVLSGADNCEFWAQQTWEQVLDGIQIVVSTHAILLDALKHAFVRMHRIALLIFDEAHHAIKKHPSSEILRLFYHPLGLHERPPILGLTATPSNKIESLGEIESNLNAISRSPQIYQGELDLFVHQPILIKLPFSHASRPGSSSSAFESLQAVFQNLNIHEDPWIMKTKSNSSDSRSLSKLSKALLNNSTHSHDQIRTLRNRAEYIETELGPFAGGLYLSKCIEKFHSGNDEAQYILEDLEDDERRYLREKLDRIVLPSVEQLSITEQTSLTPKLQVLIDFLSDEDVNAFTGLIFVKTRAEVAIISHILSMHPLTRKFSTKTFVGNSTYTGRKFKIADLMDGKSQKTTLDDLRTGVTTLIVTTNALEEGIDVVSCNVVICFERPMNLRSFVQRRGRARNPTSRYVLLLEEWTDVDNSSGWQQLEDDFGQVYQNDLREIQDFEENEEVDDRILAIESTGAQITPADAVSHLAHFCAVSTRDAFTDPSPTYTYQDTSLDPQRKAVMAKVLLPSTVDAELREAPGSYRWTNEKLARRDAAFAAYSALHNAGLVNDNLLPVRAVDPEVEAALAKLEIRPNVAETAGALNLWPDIARAWQDCRNVCASRLTVTESQNVTQMLMLLPFPCPALSDFTIYWDLNTSFSVHMQPDLLQTSDELMQPAHQSTDLLLKSVFRTRMSPEDVEFPVLFSPAESPHTVVRWLARYEGSISANEACSGSRCEQLGLVRDMDSNGVPYILRDVKYVTKYDLLAIPALRNRYPELETNTDEHHTILEVQRLPKRTDLLHQNSLAKTGPAIAWLLADRCDIDKLPYEYVPFASMVPAILYKLHIACVVDRLNNSLLLPIAPMDRQIVATAITTSAAQEPTNYQRLEFLGDSILKLQTSLALMAKHLKHFENILTRMKEHVVSNASLAQAALRTGLDQYILTTPFTGSKWRPLDNRDLLTLSLPKRRELSTKTLADVVEALIGAAYLEGGFEKALQCTSIFLPDEPWEACSNAFEILHEVYHKRPTSKTYVELTEPLLQYHFEYTSLLEEAITHVSYQAPGVVAPYERLEFLGDACLDIIVTVLAYNSQRDFPVYRLHLIRAALVNADFLGYLCLRHSTQVIRSKPLTGDPKNITVVDEARPFHLWQIMRHTSPTIREAQRGCLKRLDELQEPIATALEQSDRHPWVLLARLEPPKPFSDLVESLLGAIYIDSCGSIKKCSEFLGHLGFMTYLRRVLDADIALLHPKEELGQLSDQDEVRYVMGKRDNPEGKKWLTCSVVVGEREMAMVEDGLRPLETQTRAADMACEVLRKERPERYRRTADGKVASSERHDMDSENEAAVGDSDNNSDDDDDQSEGGGVQLDDDGDVYMTANEA